VSTKAKLPAEFLDFRREGNLAFGCAHFDAAVEVQRCAGCGREQLGPLLRFPEAHHHDLKALLEAARRAAVAAFRRRTCCSACAAAITARGRSLIYAHYAGRLRRDLLLVVRPGTDPARLKAFLISEDGETEAVEVAAGLEALAADLFHPAVVLYRQAYAAVTLTNEPERALDLLGRALVEDQGFVAAATLTADILIGYGRIAEASPYVDAALRLETDDPEANLLKGRLSIAAGFPHLARAYLEKAVANPRTASGASYRLGLVAEDAGRAAEACAAYRRALELDPDNEGAADRLAGLERGVCWRFFRSDREPAQPTRPAETND